VYLNNVVGTLKGSHEEGHIREVSEFDTDFKLGKTLFDLNEDLEVKASPSVTREANSSFSPHM